MKNTWTPEHTQMEVLTLQRDLRRQRGRVCPPPPNTTGKHSEARQQKRLLSQRGLTATLGCCLFYFAACQWGRHCLRPVRVFAILCCFSHQDKFLFSCMRCSLVFRPERYCLFNKISNYETAQTIVLWRSRRKLSGKKSFSYLFRSSKKLKFLFISILGR